MLKLTFLQDDPENKKLEWTMCIISDEDDQIKKIVNLSFEQSTLTNKFDTIKNLFEDISVFVPNEFIVWYVKMISEYIKSNFNSEIILREIPNFLLFAEKYIEAKNINFESFINHSKVTKTSILFEYSDLRALAKASVCLKLYAPILYDINLKLTDNTHKLVYTSFVQECIDLGTTTKIFQIMRSRTYKSSMTDRYIWDLIRMMITETPENYTLLMFNFLLTNMLSTLDIEKNPIPFFVSIIDDSLRWMMGNVYKDRVLYGEVFGGPGDVYGNMLNKETLHIYCCNDVIGKSAKAGMELLEKKYDITDDKFEEIRERLDNIEYISPIMQNTILPIANKVLEIPYNYLLTAPPKHISLIGILMHYCSMEILDERFPILHEFLLLAPKEKLNKIFTSSYEIKNMYSIVDVPNLVFGLNSPVIRYKIMSKICGILSVCKKTHISIISGKKVKKINYSSLESDVIQFYGELYSNKLDSTFVRMRNIVDELL